MVHKILHVSLLIAAVIGAVLTYRVGVRIREHDDGTLYVFFKQGGGSGTFQIGDRDLADLLREHWDEVRIEQLGSNGAIAVDGDEVVSLIRLTLSDDLMRVAEKKLRPSVLGQFKEALLDIRYGTSFAFQKDAVRKAAVEGDAADGS